MKRFAVIAVRFVFVAALLLGIDYQRVASRDHRAAIVVQAAGGRMGSLPMWPLGTEYFVVFEAPLSPDELASLAVLNDLRGYVGVHFRDCVLTPRQQRDTRDSLASCGITWSDGDATVRLNTP